MIYITSDMHLGHSNIIRYCNRPYKDKHEMDIDLIERWNSIINPEDTIYQLGDFSFGNPNKYMRFLNGNIISIRGNHDHENICKTWNHRLEFEYDGYKFLLNHRPVFLPGTPDPFNDSEQFGRINLDDYDWVLCGHVHDKWKVYQKNINVGIDVWGLKPVSMDTIVDFIHTLE